MFEVKCRSCGYVFKPGFKLVVVNSDIECPECKEKILIEKDPKVKRANYFLTALTLIVLFALSGVVTDLEKLFVIWAVVIVIYTFVKMAVVCCIYNRG